jgi:hypothetical protein
MVELIKIHLIITRTVNGIKSILKIINNSNKTIGIINRNKKTIVGE